MKRYINTKTGAILDSSFKITGEHWKLEEVEKIEEVEEIEETEEDVIVEEVQVDEVEEIEEINLDSLTLEELKMHADDLGITYAANIGRDTLMAKFDKGE